MLQWKRQFFISSCIYVGQALVGYSMGWTSPVIPKLQDVDQTPLPGPITEAQASLVGSFLYVGGIIGPYVTGHLSNTKGRKPCLILGGAFMLTSYVTLALAKDLVTVLIGRILTGVGLGMIFVMNLVYIGEIASTSIRGILLTMTGIFGTFGTLIIYTFGSYVPYSMTGWLGAALYVLYIGGIFTIPETPVFHVLKGRQKEAKDTLISLGRTEDIESVLSTKHNDITSQTIEWRQLFTIYTNRRALFITMTLNVLQQMSGVVAVIFFATTIFELAGSSVAPHLASIIVAVTQIVASSITPVFVDRTGRKSLLLFSTAMAFLSHTVLGFYFYLDRIDAAVVSKIQWLPLVSLVVFFMSYDLGFGIIPGTLTGEMFTPNVRSSGSVLVTTVGWVVGFGVSTAFGYMLALGADVTFWIYAGACAVAFFFSIFFVPETKGKSLTEILDMMNK